MVLWFLWFLWFRLVWLEFGSLAGANCVVVLVSGIVVFHGYFASLLIWLLITDYAIDCSHLPLP